MYNRQRRSAAHNKIICQDSSFLNLATVCEFVTTIVHIWTCNKSRFSYWKLYLFFLEITMNWTNMYIFLGWPNWTLERHYIFFTWKYIFVYIYLNISCSIKATEISKTCENLWFSSMLLCATSIDKTYFKKF
jgi:hypothetical protein